MIGIMNQGSEKNISISILNYGRRNLKVKPGSPRGSALRELTEADGKPTPDLCRSNVPVDPDDLLDYGNPQARKERDRKVWQDIAARKIKSGDAPISLALQMPEFFHTKALCRLCRSDWRRQSGSTKRQSQSVEAQTVTNSLPDR
jgi:hypothetical protein